MSGLTQQQIMEVKGRGFLRNRGTDNFSVRIVSNGAVFSAKDFANISRFSEIFGNGKVICTSRLNVEVPGIPYEKIPEAEKFAKDNGLRFGGTGAKVRPIAACKGTTCVFGNCDTHKIAKKLDEQFYDGWSNVKLEYLSDYYGIEQSSAHRAYCDEEANAHIYFKLKEESYEK